MTQNSQYPGFVEIFYHTLWGQHSMEVCHHGWNYAGGSPESGEFNTWDDGVVEADVMINDFVDTLLPFFLPTTTFDTYTIYTMADEDADPTPVYAAALDLDGTSIETEWAKAVQTTFTFRTESFNIAKLVLLDTPSAAGFDKILSFGASVEALAILAELSDETNGWSARANSRINTLVQISYTLNETLRRSYRMN